MDVCAQFELLSTKYLLFYKKQSSIINLSPCSIMVIIDWNNWNNGTFDKERQT